MQAGRIVAVKNASNYDNNSDQNQRVMRPQRGPEQLGYWFQVRVSRSMWIFKYENLRVHGLVRA